MADDDVVRPNIVKYYIGSSHLLWERVRDDDRKPIIPASAAVTLVDRDNDTTLVQSTTVGVQSGLVEYILAAGVITAPGNYYLEWDVTYDYEGDTIVKTLVTDIIAELRDSTTLMALVSRLRLLGDDDPLDASKRMKTDDQWKKYLVEAVRLFMSAYSITQSGGLDEISPVPTAESTDEKLVILWGAYIYYRFGAEAIASERTRLFSISYDAAYAQIRDRLEVIEEQIEALDDSAATYFISETDIEAYGQVTDRLTESLATWSTV
jgi:hypothetical protein